MVAPNLISTFISSFSGKNLRNIAIDVLFERHKCVMQKTFENI